MKIVDEAIIGYPLMQHPGMIIDFRPDNEGALVYH